MRRWALGSIALLSLGGCESLLGLGDFQAGDAGAAGSSTSSGGSGTTSTSSVTGGSGGATTTSTSSGGSGGATTTSTSSGGSGGGSVCTPGEVRACDYAGLEGTAGVGACRAATQTCAADGLSFGACSGEALPAIERCDTLAIDEDCDGLSACSGSFRWAKIYGAASGQLANGVAIDASGDVVVVGRFTGTVDFGGGALIATGTSGFVVKLDRLGRHVWSKALVGTSITPQAVAIDVNGTIVVTGTTNGAVDLGGGTLPAFGGTDVFVLALDPAGNHAWSKLFGGASADTPTSIAIGGGAVVLAGNHNGGIDFGGGPLAATTTDAFAAKLSMTDGAYVWAKSWGDTGVDSVNGVALDTAGNVLLTGVFANKIDFGQKTLMTAGGNDLFVAKLDSGGTQVWSNAYGDAMSQSGTGIAADASGFVFVTGTAAGSVTVGAGMTVGSGSAAQDGFVMKLGPAGVTHWSLDLGQASGPVVAIDALANVIVGASFSGALDFGGAALSSAGSNDYAIGKLGFDGSHVWSRSFGDAADQTLSKVAVGPRGEIAVAGGNIGTIDLGGGPLVSAGQNDAIVAELAP
jgi:hypothetical protein